MKDIQFFVFTIILIFLTLDLRLRAVDNESKNSYCGTIEHYINMSQREIEHKLHFNLSDREDENERFLKILADHTFQPFIGVKVAEGCTFFGCIKEPYSGPNHCNPIYPGNNPKNLFSCYNIQAPGKSFCNPGFPDLVFITISCSCKTPKQGCDEKRCQKSLIEKDAKKRDYCAKIYKEPNCNECHYDPIPLYEREPFTKRNSLTVVSMEVKPNCEVLIVNRTKSNYEDHPIPYNFYQMQLATAITEDNDLICICNHPHYKINPTTVPTKGPKESRTFWENYGMTITSFALICICISGTFSGVKLYMQIKSYRKMEEFKRVIFQMQRNFNDGNQHDDYIPFKLSYEKKYELDIKKIKLINVIDRGTFGIVHEGRLELKENPTYLNECHLSNYQFKVAVKEPNKNISSYQFLLDEIKIHSYIGYHPNIVTFIGASTVDIHKALYLVMEFCSIGNLKNYLKSPLKNVSLVESFKNRICSEIAAAMEYLGIKKIVHNDLAARNVLLTIANEMIIAKLADFGLSKRNRGNSSYMIILQDVAYRWSALEYLQEQKMSFQSDVWSFGITMWEIFSNGLDPYDAGMNFAQLKEYLENGERLRKPPSLSHEEFEMISRCWDVDPNLRPTFSELKLYFENKTDSSDL